MWFATVLLTVEAAFAAYTSWISFSRPVAFAERLGLELVGATGRNEILSQYAGLFLAMALTQGAAVVGLIPLEVGLIVGSMIFGGLALGRIWSVSFDSGMRHYTPTIRALVFLDPLGFLLSICALWIIV